jgi:Ni,Fe-hydrogenase III small subunit
MKSQVIGFRAIWSRLRNLISSRDLLTKPIARQRKFRSIFIRQVDTGSCNDCELEITALSNPIYDFERFGFHIVASPRHADVLLVTGPFTRSMEVAALVTFQAMPRPRRVVTVGDSFQEDSPFRDSYAVLPSQEEIDSACQEKNLDAHIAHVVASLPKELASAWVAHIPGDPPSPQQILDVLLTLETK